MAAYALPLKLNIVVAIAAAVAQRDVEFAGGPVQYTSGRDQMLREIAKQKQMAALAAPAQASSKPAAIE